MTSELPAVVEAVGEVTAGPLRERPVSIRGAWGQRSSASTMTIDPVPSAIGLIVTARCADLGFCWGQPCGLGWLGRHRSVDVSLLWLVRTRVTGRVRTRGSTHRRPGDDLVGRLNRLGRAGRYSLVSEGLS